jgi:MoxR-like ATPase
MSIPDKSSPLFNETPEMPADTDHDKSSAAAPGDKENDTASGLQQLSRTIDELRTQLHRVFIGQDSLIDGLLIALFCGGHVLIEGVPGLGKTLIAKALSRLVDCKFNRIQFTPDLMPSDITGSHVFNMKTREFQFYPGPVFTNILLADEINRAPAKTHSALLEIMEESHVTLDGKHYEIEPPFFTIATQNPIESEGTYALPEAQLDRFMFKLVIDYPPEADECEILRNAISDNNAPDDVLPDLTPLLDSETTCNVRRCLQDIIVDPKIIEFANAIVRRTRSWKEVYHGASPRAGITLLRGARVPALMAGRDFVTPDDLLDLCLSTLRHRVILTPEAEVEGRTVDGILEDIIQSVEVPRF